MTQIKNIAITKTTAKDNDFLLMQNPTTGETYKITKADFLAGISSTPKTYTLTFSSSGDSNGVLYLLGTSYNTVNFVNPCTKNVTITASSTESGDVTTLADRAASEWYSSNASGSWVQVQFLGKLQCNYYSLRARSNTNYYPRRWKLQGSNDGTAWADLHTVTNNTTLNAASAWVSLVPTVTTAAYKYFRILSTGVDSSGANYLTLGEIELYGTYTP